MFARVDEFEIRVGYYTVKVYYVKLPLNLVMVLVDVLHPEISKQVCIEFELII